MIRLFVACILLNSCAAKFLKRHDTVRKERIKKEQEFFGIKKKVVLLNFFNESPYGGEGLGIVAAEELRLSLSRTREFVIDPMTKKIFGDSKEIYAGGGLKLVQLTRKGKSAGVNFVVFGRIEQARVRENRDEVGVVKEVKSRAQVKIDVRIFDINSGKEVHGQTVVGQVDDNSFRLFGNERRRDLTWRRQLLRHAVRVAVRRAIPQIVQVSRRMDWIGRVAKIIGNKIYVNAGRRSGMQLGDILRVVTEGQEVYDPETGALIGMSKGEVKGTVEVIDYFGPDGSVAIIHSGGSVLEGDFVQLY